MSAEFLHRVTAEEPQLRFESQADGATTEGLRVLAQRGVQGWHEWLRERNQNR